MEFFKNLKQKTKLIKPNKTNFKRALQIFNKTNQFNFSLNRYSEKELKNVISKKNYNLMLFSLKDKFGDHGIISGCILKKESSKIFIIDFAVSCRVISRYVEDYMIFSILSKIKGLNYYINYKKTNLNNSLIPKFIKKKFLNFTRKWIIKRYTKYLKIKI